eukprot:350320-Chlamydomonas_euryale.AAC.7
MHARVLSQVFHRMCKVSRPNCCGTQQAYKHDSGPVKHVVWAVLLYTRHALHQLSSTRLCPLKDSLDAIWNGGSAIAALYIHERRHSAWVRLPFPHLKIAAPSNDVGREGRLLELIHGHRPASRTPASAGPYADGIAAGLPSVSF